MKAVFIVVAGIVIGVGCATSSTGNGSATEPAPAETPGTQVADQPSDPVEPSFAAKKGTEPPDITGMWQNGSCDKRKYVREIEFSKDGTFSARDLVSPCPPDVTCVWSGIIKWKGTWKLDGDTVLIDIEPIEMGHQPDTLPASYVILDSAPVSIGEKIDTLVCPYQKAK